MSKKDLKKLESKKITLDFLLGEYRKGGGYPILTPAMVYESGADIEELCELLCDTVGVISQQDKANIEAMKLLVNRDQKVTTPGLSETELYILKNVYGLDFDSKSESASLSEIKEVMNLWPLELSFEVGCAAMRHWALLEFKQRTTKHKPVLDPMVEKLRKDILSEYARNKGKSVSDFYDRLVNEGWTLPSQRTIERWTKDLRRSHKKT